MKVKHAEVVLLALLAGCADSGVFTLYRTSVVPGISRVHVATFDADGGKSYNSENCELAAKLFQQQPDARVRFWCEKGRFRP